MDPDFWHRWETLRVDKSGQVERLVTRDDGELIWMDDE